MDCQRNMTHSIRHEKRATNKNWEKNGTMYCLGCKDYTDHFKPQEVKMTNKVLRKKSNCVVCRSSKSGFLKQKIKQDKKVLKSQLLKQVKNKK